MGDSETVHVGALSAQFENILLPFGLTVDRMTLTAKEASAQLEPFSLEMDQPASVEAIVHESSLEKFVRLKAPDNVRIESVVVRPEGIMVEAVVRVLLEFRGIAKCRLRVESGSRLMVELVDVDVLGVGAKGLVQNQIEGMNPVLDTATLPFQITLHEAKLEHGFVRVTGEALP